MAGRSIEKLSKVLGHYSIVMTENYAHLRPDLFVDEERAALRLDLSGGAAEPLELGPRTGRALEEVSPSPRNQKEKAGAAL